jgi:hypothetical protein
VVGFDRSGLVALIGLIGQQAGQDPERLIEDPALPTAFCDAALVLLHRQMLLADSIPCIGHRKRAVSPRIYRSENADDSRAQGCRESLA